jgi:hypothetical protein
MEITPAGTTLGADWLHVAWFREREAVGEVRYKQLLDLMMMLREEQAMRHRCVP